MLSVAASTMPPAVAAPFTVVNVDENWLNGTAAQLLSLQSAVGFEFLSNAFAPFWSVPALGLTVPSAYRFAFAIPWWVRLPGFPLLSSPTKIGPVVVAVGP